MKSTRKRVSLIGAVGEAEGALRDLLIARPRAWLKEARERLRDLPKANYDLGYGFAQQGKWFDAVFRFRVTLFLNPNYPQANYNMGRCYMRMGKTAAAKAALLKALAQSPGNTDVIFMLATIDPAALAHNQRPERMPSAMVTGFFTAMADGYDIAEANNRYQAGRVMHELLAPLLKNQTPTVLDLACGSGIAARPWRLAAKTIRGVDVTPAMLELAEKATHADKKLYDGLVTGDVAALDATLTDGTADLVLLVNAAQFIGELATVFAGIAKALASGGIAAVTVEPYSASGGFGLMSGTGRFGHSAAYVKQVAQAAGLTVIKETNIELYAGVPAQALLFSKGNI